MAEGDGGHQPPAVWHAEAVRHRLLVVEQPEQARAEPGVDHTEQQVLGGGAGVDGPVGGTASATVRLR